MTQVGKVLERTKLDELPQLCNILKGDMSFVGPRPESIHLADLLKREYEKVLDFIPGIFGPNQVKFRNESLLYPPEEDPEQFYRRVLFQQKAENDLAYFPQATMTGDLFWIFKGLWVSLKGVLNWGLLYQTHAAILLTDLIALIFSWTIINFIRFFGMPTGNDFYFYLQGYSILVPGVLLFLIVTGVYKTPLRHFGLYDTLNLGRKLFYSVVIISFFWVGFKFRNTSFYLIPGFYIFSFIALLTARGLSRICFERRHGNSHCDTESKRILIYGAGKVGTSLVNWIKFRLENIQILGFIDDALLLQGRKVSGLPVLGSERDISNINGFRRVDEIWLAFLPDGKKKKRLESICGEKGIVLVSLLEQEPFCRFVH
jgi:hypothetical protein